MVSLIALWSCNQTSSTTVGIHVKGGKPDVKPMIYTKDSTYTVDLDSIGSGKVVLANNLKAGYANLVYGRVKVQLYLEPHKSLDVSMNFEGNRMTPEFSGEGAKINEYLSKHRSGMPDFKAEEEQFIRSLEEMEKTEFAALDTLGLDEAFVKKEKQRLHYAIFRAFPVYPSYHQYYNQLDSFEVSNAYYDYLKSLIKEDETLLDLEEYKAALATFVQTQSLKDLESNDSFERLKTTLDYINNNMTNPAVVSFLVDRFVSGYVSSNGVDQLEQLAPIYNAKVTDPELKAEFEKICEKWAKVAKGQPSPTFKYLDIDGKEVSLSDLAGKYVYVDVWATWCGPCRGEIPHLKELEKKYKDKNIYFVSISCDQDKAAWEKMVKEQKLEGVQLHKGEDREFMETFMIRSIPRFILLDPEGKIVSAVMTRPSNPKTVETLDALLGV